jgi:hypothetical protein
MGRTVGRPVPRVERLERLTGTAALVKMVRRGDAHKTEHGLRTACANLCANH